MFKRLIMKRTTIFWICFFFSYVLYANNNVIINGVFLNNTKYNHVYLEKFSIGSSVIASSKIVNDSFYLELPNTIEAGVYRLKYSLVETNSYFDIIINGREKNITFTFDFNASGTLPVFAPNSENEIYYSFLSYESERIKSLLVQQFFLQNYPNLTDKVFKKVNKNYDQDIKKIRYERTKFINSNRNATWAVSIIKNKSFHFTENFRNDQRIIEFENHEKYWDHFEVNNEKLLNTPLFVDHILVYLQYYLNSNLGLNKEEVEKGLMNCVDTIMHKFSTSDKIQEFALRYLIDGFTEIGYTNIVTYIFDKYANLILKYTIQKKSEVKNIEINPKSKLEIGSIVPNIEWKKNENQSIANLHQIEAKEILLIFWSSDCPHCEEVMKKADEWANTAKNKLVVAVGIEYNKDQYLDKIKRFKNIWHYSDFKGFESSLLNDFKVEVTPTLFIIDENKRIINVLNRFPF